MSHRAERVRRRRHCALAALAALTLAGSGCASLPVDGDSEAALVLEALAKRGGRSRLEATTDSPERSATRFAVSGEAHAADLYTPSGPARAALLLVPGLAPAGKDDGRLVRLADTLARVGFRVLVPDIPGFRSYAVRSEAVEVIAAAFAHLEETPGSVPAGLGAFSFAVGPTLIAAARGPIRERVAFVAAVGGYYDLHRLIGFYTTGRAHAGGAEREAASPSTAKWVLAIGVAQRLASPSERAALTAIAKRRLLGRVDGVEEAAAGLGRDARAVYELLTNTERARVPALIAALPDAIRAELEALNPAAHGLERLAARLIVIHGRADPIIPHTESLAMAQALAPAQVSLFLIDGLAHVDLAPRRHDLPILLAAIEALLAERRPR